MANVSPNYFDAASCVTKSMADGDKVAVKHIPVSAVDGNLLSAEADGLAVTADDFISSEEGNLIKKSNADGGALLKATDIIADESCNILDVDNNGKLVFHVDSLISNVEGGNVLGVNPDDCKLFINPCLLPGPQNIVSKDEANLIKKDPDDCSALLRYTDAVSEDAGNLIQKGEDGKLKVDLQYMVDRGYFGAGLVYVEKQDGTHVLQVAACNGLKFNAGTVEDTYGNSYEAKWLEVNLDESQNIMFFKEGDGCVECFTNCKQLSIEFSLNAEGQRLRILDRNGKVYTDIPLSNGLIGDGTGGMTIDTLDTLATTAPNNDLPVSSKAVKAAIDALRDELIPHAHATTKYGAATNALYGHVKLSDSTTATSGQGDGIAATPKAVKDAKDAVQAAVDNLKDELKADVADLADKAILTSLVAKNFRLVNNGSGELFYGIVGDVYTPSTSGVIFDVFADEGVRYGSTGSGGSGGTGGSSGYLLGSHVIQRGIAPNSRFSIDWSYWDSGSESQVNWSGQAVVAFWFGKELAKAQRALAYLQGFDSVPLTELLSMRVNCRISSVTQNVDYSYPQVMPYANAGGTGPMDDWTLFQVPDHEAVGTARATSLQPIYLGIVRKSYRTW